MAKLCEPGTDCEDCGVRIFCLDCPPACHARNMQKPSEACMESQWNDGKCDPFCNNRECEFNDCTLSQISDVCIQSHLDQGLDLSGPPLGAQVIMKLDLEKPLMGIDSKTNQMMYTTTVGYTLSWTDPRLATSTCGIALDAMLTQKVGDAPNHARKYFWVPDPYAVNADEASNKMVGFSEVKVNLTDGATTVTAERTQKFSQDFSFAFYPFDTHTVELDISVPGATVNCSHIAEHLKTLPVADMLPLKSSPWVLRTDVAGGPINADAYVHENGMKVPSRCVVKISIYRNAVVYLVSRLVPILLIGLAALMVLWVNPATMPPRYSVLIFGMVLMSLKTNAGLGLGKLTYLIWIDYLKTLMFCLFMSALVTNIIIHTNMRENTETSKALAQRIDQIARVLFPFVLYPLVTASMLMVGFEHVSAGLLFGVICVCLLLLIFGLIIFLRIQARNVLKRRWAEEGLALLEIDLNNLAPDEAKAIQAKTTKLIKNAFEIFDSDKSRSLDKTEVYKLVEMLHQDTPTSKLGKMSLKQSSSKVKTEEAVRAEVDALKLVGKVDLETFAHALKKRYHEPKQSGKSKDIEAAGAVPKPSSKPKPSASSDTEDETESLARAIAQAIVAHKKKKGGASSDDVAMSGLLASEAAREAAALAAADEEAEDAKNDDSVNA